MPAQFERLKGFADLYGEQLNIFQYLENTARLVFPRFGYGEIRPPLLEATELFQRGIGEETDVVGKEMFTFSDRKGRSLTLRPEATAGVLRAAIDAGLANPGQLARLFTIGPMFRYERPQKGRMRQFHQINAECLGSDSPYADAEIILMLLRFLAALDLRDLGLKINSLGCRRCRPDYLDKLRAFLKNNAAGLCADCQRRMETNPLRALDCKICHEKLAEAPAIMNSLCADCRAHFDKVLELLSLAGIAYDIDFRLVRGLDYYARTTFEVVSGRIGAQTAVAGGGRYDGLVAQLGGPDAPGVGFACGMERLALLAAPPAPPVPDFYIVALDDAARREAFLLADNLRAAGLRGEISYASSGMKSLMRQAARSGAALCLIIGPDELAQGKASVKDMRGGGQSLVELAKLRETVLQMLGRQEAGL